ETGKRERSLRLDRPADEQPVTAGDGDGERRLPQRRLADSSVALDDETPGPRGKRPDEPLELRERLVPPNDADGRCRGVSTRLIAPVKRRGRKDWVRLRGNAS